METPQVISDKLARIARLVVGLLSLARHWFRAKDARGLYDNFASRYDDVFGDDKLATEGIIKEHLHGGSKILDVACGTGLTTFPLLAKYLGVFGIDISREMLKKTRRKFGCEMICFFQGNFADLPFKDDSFDAITCVGAIWHLKESEEMKFVDEIWRVLKPGGVFITTVQAFKNKKSWGLRLRQFFGNRSFVRNKIQLGKFDADYIVQMFPDEKFLAQIGKVRVEKDGKGFDWPIVKVIKWSAPCIS